MFMGPVPKVPYMTTKLAQRKLSSQELLPSRDDETNVPKEDGRQEFSIVDGGPSKKRKLSEWNFQIRGKKLARTSPCGQVPNCRHEIHEGPCMFARDVKFKEDSQDTDEKHVASNLFPQDIKPTCSSELEGAMNCNSLDVDGGNKDIFSLSAFSSGETFIQVNYFKLVIAN